MSTPLTHTPGPWEATNAGLVVDGQGRTLAIVQAPRGEIALGEAEANAALIAQAPALAAEVAKLRDERDRLRDAVEEALTWRGTDTTHAKLRAALERPAP